MRANQAGIDLIKRFEGCKLSAYQDSVGVWTIGYGHTAKVKRGDTITQPQAENLLRDDLVVFEAGVFKALHGVSATPNQFAAMVSLAFNIGLGAFGRSSVLKYHRDRAAPETVGRAFLLWNRAGGKVLAGLTRRREAERALYLQAEP